MVIARLTVRYMFRAVEGSHVSFYCFTMVLFSNIPKVQVYSGDDGTIHLSIREVSTGDIGSHQTARTSRVNGHAGTFDIERIADSVTQDRTPDSRRDGRGSILRIPGLDVSVI